LIGGKKITVETAANEAVATKADVPTVRSAVTTKKASVNDRPVKKFSKVCRGFLAGKCTLGDACKYAFIFGCLSLSIFYIETCLGTCMK